MYSKITKGLSQPLRSWIKLKLSSLARQIQKFIKKNNFILLMSQEQTQDLDKQKVIELQKRKLQQESEALSNQLRTAFGYSPWLNAKASNYKTQRMPVKPMEKELDHHALKKDIQLQPLQKLIQEEHQKVMVMEQGIDTEETTRFFIEKIKEYNSIIDLEHIKKNKRNYYSNPTSINADYEPPKKILDEPMKRYTGDQGQITNFHFVINWQNLVPVFKELSPEKQQASKSVPITQRDNEITKIQRTNRVVRKKQVFIPHIKRKGMPSQRGESQWIKKMEQKFKLIDEKSEDIIIESPPQEEVVPPTESQIHQKQFKSRGSILTQGSSMRNSLANKNTLLLRKNKKTILELNEEPTIRSHASSDQKQRTEKQTIESNRQQNHRSLSYQEKSPLVHSEFKVLGKDVSFKLELISKMINDSFDQDKIVNYLSNKEQLFQHQVHSKLLRSMVWGKIIEQSDEDTFEENHEAKKKVQSDLQNYLLQQNPQLISLFIPQIHQLRDQYIQGQNQKDDYQDMQVAPVIGKTPSKVKIRQSFSSAVENNNNSVQETDPQYRDQQLLSLATSPKPKILRIRSISDDQVVQPELVKVQEQSELISFGDYTNVNIEVKGNAKTRQTVIDNLIAKKQPKFVHPGGTKFAILNTPDNIKLYKTKKSRIEEIQLQEIEKFKQRPVRAQEHMMTNLQVLQGPPKKLEFNTTDLKHDYNDLKVSKMMKQLITKVNK